LNDRVVGVERDFATAGMKMGPYCDHLTGPKLQETIVGNEWRSQLASILGRNFSRLFKHLA
jgi:hypothetical protein